MGTVTFNYEYFMEDEIVDGALGPITVDTFEYEVSAYSAANLIIQRGLSFAATGNDWAGDPDGSYIANYSTGQRCSATAHLSNFDERVVNAIIERVG